VDEVIYADARQAVDLMQKVEAVTDGKMCDVVIINCVNMEDCEMGSILATKDGGVVYFFSMATSFTKAVWARKASAKT
jgi:L-erythro-3,5-diaminohexanoate dehydrogenase